MSITVRIKSFSIVTALFFAGIAADAAVIRVPADQPTIQGAINAAINGDVIQVAPGTYVENLNFLGKAIRVTSDQGPQVTIIDGNRVGPVVTFGSGEGSQSILDGFTLRNGRGGASASYRGGGVRISNASPTIAGNIITNNDAADGGGGISVSFGSPLIQSNTIMFNGQTPGYSGGVGGGGVAIVGASSVRLLNNTISGNSWATSSGGGVTLFAAGTPTIQNNWITKNNAYSQGGGMWIVNQSDAAIVQNIISSNSAPTGGGVYWMVPSGARGPFLTNNTIADNNGGQGSGIFADGFDGQAQLINNIIVGLPGQNAVTCGTFNDTNTPVFQFNDVFSPSGLAYGGVCAKQTGLNGNISVDPLFNYAPSGDYRLQFGSPAIDAGTSNQAPLADIQGVARPQDGNGDCTAAFDMGAFESPGGDCVPPVTAAMLTPSPNNAGWNKTNVTVDLNAADNPGGSGVQSIHYSLTGAQTNPEVAGPNPASVTITAQGATTVNYWAVDSASNTETAKSQPVKIDRTNPVISGMPSGCELSPPKHQLVTVAAITASDSLSGVASLYVAATSSEADSGTGGGDVAGDIVINGGAVQLRAERSPSGRGRIYTITSTATDFAGNSVTTSATCSVPK